MMRTVIKSAFLALKHFITVQQALRCNVVTLEAFLVKMKDRVNKMRFESGFQVWVNFTKFVFLDFVGKEFIDLAIKFVGC